MSDGRNESAAGCAELAECVSDLINTFYVEFGFDLPHDRRRRLSESLAAIQRRIMDVRSKQKQDE